MQIEPGLTNISAERRCFLYFCLKKHNCEKTRAISADISILNYFKWKKKEASLPDPKGPYKMKFQVLSSLKRTGRY